MYKFWAYAYRIGLREKKKKGQKRKRDRKKEMMMRFNFWDERKRVPRICSFLKVVPEVQCNYITNFEILLWAQIIVFLFAAECRVLLMTIAEEIVVPLRRLSEKTWTAKELYATISGEALWSFTGTGDYLLLSWGFWHHHLSLSIEVLLIINFQKDYMSSDLYWLTSSECAFKWPIFGWKQILVGKVGGEWPGSVWWDSQERSVLTYFPYEL